jgi:hypothetical protein
MKRLRHVAILASIFFSVFISHVSSRNITSLDSKWSIPTALSIIKEGNTDLDEYKEMLEKYNYFAIERIDGHYYTIYPMGVSLIAIPFVYAIEKSLDILSSTVQKLGKYYTKDREYVPLDYMNIASIAPGIELFIASFIVAANTIFIYLICHRFFERKYSLLISFIFAFCTSAWSTASRGLWQHGPSMLLLTITLWLILLSKKKPRWIQFSAIPLAFSYVVRPTNSISIFLLTVFVFIQYRHYVLRYFLWAMTVAIPFTLFNLSVHHSFLSPYYKLWRVLRLDQDFFAALAGNLISPSRGLFIFSPIIVFSLYGIILKMKEGKFGTLDCFVLCIIVLHWITISSFPQWWGGHSFGPRYFSDMVPYFIYFLIPGVTGIVTLKGAKRVVLLSLFLCCVLSSFLIHYRGATDWDVLVWNRRPVNVDENPTRLWDWHDIQFLRGIK